jgi:hypothetical protein
MRRFLPSPSMVVAVVAVVLAVGGTATAATLISGARLKNRSVPDYKIKINSLDSNEIAESRLNTVPRAKASVTAFSAAAAGGLQPKKLNARLPAGTDDTTVLDLGGLTLIGSCPGGNPALSARSNANDGQLKGSVVNGGGQNAAVGLNRDDFDTGSTQSILGGKQQGQGTIVYSRPDGGIVQVTYAFADAPTQGAFNGCVFSGTGFAG